MHLDQITKYLLVRINPFDDLEWNTVLNNHSIRINQNIFVLKNNCALKAFHCFCIDDVLERLDRVNYFEELRNN